MERTSWRYKHRPRCMLQLGEKKKTHNAIIARLGGKKKCTPLYELGYLFLAAICGNAGFQNPQGTGERTATIFFSRMFVLSSVPPQQLLR